MPKEMAMVLLLVCAVALVVMVLRRWVDFRVVVAAVVAALLLAYCGPSEEPADPAGESPAGEEADR